MTFHWTRTLRHCLPPRHTLRTCLRSRLPAPQVLALTLGLTLGLASAAQAQIFACQSIDATGFSWKGSRWARTGFMGEKPFFLRVENGMLTKESAAIPLNATLNRISCVRETGTQTVLACSDYATLLSFSPDSGNGSVAKIFGSTQRSGDTEKDTVSVDLFTCQRM